MEKEQKAETKVIQKTVESTSENITIVKKAGVKQIDKITGKYFIKPAKPSWLATLNPKHDGAILFSKSFIMLSPERQSSTGLVVRGFDDKVAVELEDAMNMKRGTLSAYNKEYWADWKQWLKIPKEGVMIDTDRSALDKLHYLLARVNSKVALSYTELLDKPEAELVMVSEIKESELASKKFEVKTKAYKKYSEMSITDQLNFLKVYKEGRFKTNKDASPDFIASTVGKVVDENPKEFLDTINDPNFKTNLFMQECIQIRAITKSGSKYFANGGDLLGNTFMQTLENLQSPDYQEVVISLKQKLEAINK